MLRLQCFGQLTVRRGDEPVGGSAMQPRRLAVLAILARAGARGVPRDTVLRLLWPDEDEEKGKRVLSQAIYMLRRDLGSEEAIDGSRVLMLNAMEFSNDVQQFERAIAERRFADAVRVYEGPFLDGFILPSAPEFMRWVDDSRDALALAFADALESAAGEAKSRGELPEVAALWRRRAGIDATDGRVARQMMEALEAAGDRAGAIRHATVYAALTEQELGIPGNPDVLAFAEELKSRKIERVIPNTTPVVVTPAAADVPAASPMNTPSEIPVASLVEFNTASDQPASTVAASASSDVAQNSSPSGSASNASSGSILTRTEQHRVHVAWWKGARTMITTCVGIAAVVAGIFWFKRDKKPLFDEHRVLVAPLVNRTGDSSLDPYGLMVAEWVTQGLSNTGLVQVVDAHSILETASDFPSTGRADSSSSSVESTLAVAARLRAGLVLTGSIYKDTKSDSVFVQIRIVNASTGEVRPIPEYRIDAAHSTAALEPIRTRVAGALATLIDKNLAHTGATGSEPPTFEAYAEYLQGIQSFGRDNPKALTHFMRATSLDSSFRQARLWSGMAFANTRRYHEAESTFKRVEREKLAPYDQANFDYFRSGFMDGNWERSLESAKKMLVLAPNAGHARYAVGLTSIFTLKLDDGIRELGQISLAHGFGKDWAPRIIFLRLRGYETVGDYEEALLLAKQLRENDPEMGWQRVAELRNLARTHAGTNGSPVFTRRLQEAMALPASNIGWEPFDPGDMLHQVALSAKFVGDSVLADSLWQVADGWYRSRSAAELKQTFVERGHARVLYQLNKFDASLALYRDLDQSPSGIPEDRAMQGVIAIRKGDTATATTIARALESDTASYRFGQPRAWAARIAALLNQPERVAQLLYRARREGYTRQWEAQVDPSFTRLRNVESFQDVMAPFVTDGTRGRTSRPRS